MTIIEAMKATLVKKLKAYDERRDRFQYLVSRFAEYQSLNPEQAEAYISRAELHEKKLETGITEIITLKEGLEKMREKAHG